MGWLQTLQTKWKVDSLWKVGIILLVFAFTGTTVLLIAKPVLAWCFEPALVPLWGRITYYILILPIYNLLLLGYGFIFGQFNFFFDFEKRFFSRIISKFRSR